MLMAVKTWAIDWTFSIEAFWVIYRKVAKLLGAILLKAITSFVMPVCPHTWNSSATIGRIFMKINIDDFFKIYWENTILIKLSQE